MLATANSSNSTIVYDTFGPCEPSKVNNKCPAIMFAAKRIAKVPGRMILLIVSIITIAV